MIGGGSTNGVVILNLCVVGLGVFRCCCARLLLSIGPEGVYFLKEHLEKLKTSPAAQFILGPILHIRLLTLNFGKV